MLTAAGTSPSDFEDNDRSADGGKRRPAYDGLLAAVDERRLDAVVTWHNDRLHRSPRELEIRCHDGSELAFVTTGRKRLRAALDAARS